MDLNELNEKLQEFFDTNNIANDQRVKIIELVNKSYKLGYEQGSCESNALWDLMDGK